MMVGASVAFVTCTEYPTITDDDRLAVHVLEAHGMRVSAAAWDDPSVSWSRFDAIVIRSTWNYHHAPAAYSAWLRSLASANCVLWNPADVVLGNMHKRYLIDWAARGVAVVPSHDVPAASGYELRRLLEERGWHDAVIKPAVSASADGTWRTSCATAEADQPRFAQQSRAADLLVQPYLPEVATQGEWSLLFFAQQFSHAVLKHPAHGDFRVQGAFGGRFAVAAPHPDLIAQAQAVLSMLDAPVLYARVDGLEIDGRFVLMELEVNEPCLFLGASPDAPTRFAQAIMTVL
jgi:hypothetical protein